MANQPTPDPVWRKSAHSAANGDCVEVAMHDGVVLIRDSKDPDGPVLAISTTAWQAFIDAVKMDAL